MRISDWSSDVCSSDLRHAKSGQHLDPNREFSAKFGIALERVCQYPARQQRERESAAIDHAHVGRFGVFFGQADRTHPFLAHDRAIPDSAHHEARQRRKHDTERSEEHTSELQSLMRISYAVFCLKKKKQNTLNLQ